MHFSILLISRYIFFLPPRNIFFFLSWIFSLFPRLFSMFSHARWLLYVLFSSSAILHHSFSRRPFSSRKFLLFLYRVSFLSEAISVTNLFLGIRPSWIFPFTCSLFMSPSPSLSLSLSLSLSYLSTWKDLYSITERLINSDIYLSLSFSLSLSLSLSLFVFVYSYYFILLYCYFYILKEFNLE